MFYLTKLLVKLFVKDSDNCDNPKVRTAYGNLSGVCGIILNLLLFGGKLFAGIVSASVSVIADALNNLSDAGSSVVTFLGFKLASRPADREHPFGHGRYEYVAGLGISVVILLMGVELIKSSIEKIITPEDKTAFSTLSLAIMIASIFVKLWMYFFNSGLSRKINSTALKAAALDSLTDCIATSVVIIGLLISASTGVQIDGCRQKIGAETMKLYKAEKVNPLGGCLPLLIQMPILIALYWTLMESTELRQSSFILWITDLSVKDTYFVLPILYGISMFLLQKISPTPITDPIQKKVFMAMPFVFTFMFCTFPAGLTLYWLVSNSFTIFQQFIIFRSLEKRGLSLKKAPVAKK